MEWITKNPNVSEYPMARDNLLTIDSESRVKWKVPKTLTECSMRQLHNEIIDSPDEGGLLGSRHANTHYVIFSDTILSPLAPPQLRPITDHHKIMCGCDICNTSKYSQ